MTQSEKTLSEENAGILKALKSACKKLSASQKAHDDLIESELKPIASMLSFKEVGHLIELTSDSLSPSDFWDEKVLYNELVKILAFDVWEIRKIQAEQAIEKLSK